MSVVAAAWLEDRVAPVSDRHRASPARPIDLRDRPLGSPPLKICAGFFVPQPSPRGANAFDPSTTPPPAAAASVGAASAVTVSANATSRRTCDCVGIEVSLQPSGERGEAATFKPEFAFAQALNRKRLQARGDCCDVDEAVPSFARRRDRPATYSLSSGGIALWTVGVDLCQALRAHLQRVRQLRRGPDNEPELLGASVVEELAH